jgi:hypothetical protein
MPRRNGARKSEISVKRKKNRFAGHLYAASPLKRLTKFDFCGCDLAKLSP